MASVNYPVQQRFIFIKNMYTVSTEPKLLQNFSCETITDEPHKSEIHSIGNTSKLFAYNFVNKILEPQILRKEPRKCSCSNSDALLFP